MISAISGDKRFIEKVKNSKMVGFIHSTFKRTINFRCATSGELYTIATKEIDNAPNTLIIDASTFEDLVVNENDFVQSKNSTLSISKKWSISVENANEWNAHLPIYPTNTNVLRNNLQLVKEIIQTHSKNIWVIENADTKNLFDYELTKLLKERSEFLMDEIKNERMDKALQHAVSLIGLGKGLTPSGDDFLVGLLTIFNIKNSPYHNYRQFCTTVVKEAKNLTNEISYMALKKASKGEVRESIIQLINNLVNGNEEDLISSLNQVLSIGSSSGADIAMGLIAGLEANLLIGG